MTFESPSYLLLGAATLFAVAAGLWSQGRRRRRLGDFLGGRRAVERVSSTDLYRGRLERVVLLGVCAALLGVAVAGPRLPSREMVATEPPPVRTVVLALDVSASMQATDAAPTRLALARSLAERVLGELPDDRVGLLVFAGQAYPLAPPTHDHRPIRYLLEGISPTIASAHDPGTRPSEALDAARELLARGPEESPAAGERVIVLLTDGEAGESSAATAAAVSRAVADGILVHAVGIGTEAGAGMTMPAAPFQLGGPVLAPDGTPARSRLRAPALRRIAEQGGGMYVGGSDEAGLQSLMATLRRPPPPVVPEIDTPGLWRRFDPATLMAAAALVGLLLESLLDVRRPRLVASLRRRLA